MKSKKKELINLVKLDIKNKFLSKNEILYKVSFKVN